MRRERLLFTLQSYN